MTQNYDYRREMAGIRATQVTGFFAGWETSPTPDRLWRTLTGCDFRVLALEPETRRVVGFVYAITDACLSAYIPLIEVLPAHRGRGVGTRLMTELLGQLGDYYMIDACCDDSVAPFYENLGFRRLSGMVLRNYRMQGGIGA